MYMILGNFGRWRGVSEFVPDILALYLHNKAIGNVAVAWDAMKSDQVVRPESERDFNWNPKQGFQLL